MEQLLQEYLVKYEVSYKLHEHPAVFTVEEASKLRNAKGMFHAKCLFLKDKGDAFYLVCIDAHERADLDTLKEKLNAKKRLSFASSEELKERLNLTPGSVSIFGMIHAKDVKLVLDKRIWEADKVGFHPNVNTETLELTHNDLEKFYNSLNCEKVII